MDEEEYEVYSEKYELTGHVCRYGMGYVLCFTYEGKNIAMAVHGARYFGNDVLETMEAYIELFAPDAVKNRKLQLHNWCLRRDEQNGEVRAYGNISGSLELEDTARVTTDPITQIEINEYTGEAVLHTSDVVYYSPLTQCRFRKQDAAPELLPKYKEIKAKYGNIDRSGTIEPGSIVVVLSNFDEYYFHDLLYNPKEGEKQIDWSAYAHTGLVQDSYLIMSDFGEIDLRYFTHYRNVSFYSADTNGCTLYLENVGDVVLYAEIDSMQFKLLPGKRVRVEQVNALKERVWLPRGDLYSV